MKPNTKRTGPHDGPDRHPQRDPIARFGDRLFFFNMALMLAISLALFYFSK